MRRELSGREQGFPVERSADGFEGGQALSSARFDHRPHVGEERRPLVGAEAVDDLEEVGPELHALPAERHPGIDSRQLLQGGVQALVELGAVLVEGAVCEVRAPVTDPNRILQDFLDQRSKGGVAALDGIFDIPELVGVMPTSRLFRPAPGCRRWMR